MYSTSFPLSPCPLYLSALFFSPSRLSSYVFCVPVPSVSPLTSLSLTFLLLVFHKVTPVWKINSTRVLNAELCLIYDPAREVIFNWDVFWHFTSVLFNAWLFGRSFQRNWSWTQISDSPSTWVRSRGFRKARANHFQGQHGEIEDEGCADD